MKDPRTWLASMVVVLLAMSPTAAEEGNVGRIYVDVSGSVDETVKPVLAYLPKVFLRTGVRRLEIYTFAEARDSLRGPLFAFDLPMNRTDTTLCRAPSERERMLRAAHEAYLEECSDVRRKRRRELDGELSEVLTSIESALLSIDFEQDRPSCINEAIQRGLSQTGLNVVLTDGIVWGEGCLRDVDSLKRLFGTSDSSRTIVGLAMARGEESLAGLAERVEELQSDFPNANVVPAFTLMSGDWALQVARIGPI